MGNVVEFEVFRDHLGVGATDPAVDDVGKLYDALNAECRRLTGRQFEGDGGATYDQVIRTYGAREITLPRAPVASITSIARQSFAGEDDDALDTERYRLVDGARGRIVLASPAYEYIHVVWVTTGDIPAQVIEGFLEWGKDRWDQFTSDRSSGLASYSTGQDSESYFQGLAGSVPAGAMQLILACSVRTLGAVI